MTDSTAYDPTWNGYGALLADRLVSLADTLVEDFDVVDLMGQLVDTSMELLRADAAALMLRDSRGNLQLVASSSEETRLLELLQLQDQEGPCLDCIRNAQPVTVEKISESGDRWPHFAPKAGALGFLSVHAAPLRLRDQVVGGLNLFRNAEPPLTQADRRLAQALADIATIGLLQHRALSRATLLAEQLQGALNSRVVIEQAKGVLAEFGRVDMETAFALMRGHARSSNERLSDVAHGVVRRAIPLDVIVQPPQTRLTGE
jgi:GAF domain-containing protein